MQPEMAYVYIQNLKKCLSELPHDLKNLKFEKIWLVRGESRSLQDDLFLCILANSIICFLTDMKKIRIISTLCILILKCIQCEQNGNREVRSVKCNFGKLQNLSVVF